MTKDQVNPSPKDQFQQSSENIKAHHELIQSPVYERAEEFALAHYTRALAGELARTTDPQASQVKAMQNGLKMLGAHEFIAELRNLAEKPIVTQSPGLGRVLDHKN